MRTADDPIHLAVQQAHALGQQQALAGVFAALGQSLATQLFPALTKAHTPARAHQKPDAELESDPHVALLLAQLDHMLRCRESARDHKPGHHALHALWHDPEALAGVLAPHVGDDKHFQKTLAYALFLKAAEHSPKGGIHLAGKWFSGGQWIPAKTVAAATPEERKYLESRKSGETKSPRTKADVRKHVAQVATDIITKPDERVPDKLRDLAEATAEAHERGAISDHDLRALRLKLGAELGETPRNNQMVAGLLDHADNITDPLAMPVDANEAAKVKPPKPGSYALVNTDSLSIDPARFQFKLKVDASGVTKELSKVKQFNPDFAGVISVWYDPTDKKTYVVNGHHRYELARRTGYPHLAVRYLDAKDAREARAKGALINIAEGRGSALDAAKFLRDSGRGPDDLFAHGISPDGALARDAAVLTKLNDYAFDRLARGQLDMPTALAVAKHLADPTRQEKLFKLIARREEEGKSFSNRHIEEMARQMSSAPSALVDRGDSLFDTGPTEEDTFEERAELASHVRSELAKEHHDYSALSSERRAGATAEAGNVLNTTENQKRAASADANRTTFDAQAHLHGPVSDALNAGAVAYKQAKTRKERDRVRSETLARVREAVARTERGQAAGTGEAADRGRMGGMDEGSPQGSGTEQGTPAQTSAGQTAEDGRGEGAGGTGLAPSVADIAANPAAHAAPEPLSPNGEGGAGGTAKPVSPLHALANLAGDKPALAAEAKRLADLAGKTSSQGGNLDFHDAAAAALRGEHGPDVRDAVSNAMGDWDAHKGDTAKRYARIAEEVSKLGAKAEPQAQAAQDAPTEQPQPQALGSEKVSEHAPPSEEEFAAASKPAGELPSVADVVAKPAEHAPPPETAADKRAKRQVEAANYSTTAEVDKQLEEVNRSLNFSYENAVNDPSKLEHYDALQKQLLAKRDELAERERLSPPNATRGRIGRAGAARPGDIAPHIPSRAPGRHNREAAAYGAHSVKEIVETPDMTAREKAAARAASANTLPIEHYGQHSEWRDAIKQIPLGDSRFIGGQRVRRTTGDKYQVEKRGGGFLTGTGDEILSHLESQAEKESGFESAPAALERAKNYADPDPFESPADAARDAELRDAVPEGARAVSLDENTHGRIGTVRRDERGTYLQFAGGGETRGHDFEPLDAAHSWRASPEEAAARKPKGGTTESMFGEEPGDEGAKNALANREAELKEGSDSPKGGFYADWDAAHEGSAGLAKARNAAMAVGIDHKSNDTEELVRKVKERLDNPHEMTPEQAYRAALAGAYRPTPLGIDGDEHLDTLLAIAREKSDDLAADDLRKIIARDREAKGTVAEANRRNRNAAFEGALDKVKATVAAAKKPAAPKPSSPNETASSDVLDLTPESVRSVWEHNRDQIAASNKKMSPNEAGSIAAARILNERRKAKSEYLDAIDAKVRGGGDVAPEEDDKYIKLGDERGELQTELAKLSGYRPMQHTDEHPEAQEPVAFPSGDQLSPPNDSGTDIKRDDDKSLSGANAEKTSVSADSGSNKKPAETSGSPLPHVALAHALASRLASGQLEKNELWKHADEHFGGTRAEGKYGPSEAYDALEAGFNKSLQGQTDPSVDLAEAKKQAEALETLVNALPTQTNRSGTKESHQQFSTPPHYSYAANWIANIKPGEHVLEPSAGTGDLAVHAQNAGANVVTNELDPKRADYLRDLFGAENTHVENAEQISGILPKRGVPQPSVVVMNPPFSQTAGRMGDKKELMTGARHIAEAGRMLAPGGRLVSIVGGGTSRGDPTRGAGMSPNAPTYKKWFREMAANGFTLRANVGVPGGEYHKYGTTFPTRLLVFDKRPPTADDRPVLGDATSISDLMEKLEGVRNDRPELASQPSGKQAGDGVPEGAESAARSGDAAAPATGDGVPEAGEAEDVSVAGIPSGTEGASGTATGTEPGAGGPAAGAGVRALRKRTGRAVGTAAAAGADGASGSTASLPNETAVGTGGGSGAGGKPVSGSGVRPPARVKIEPRAAKPDSEPTKPAGGEADQLGESLYEKYAPARLNIPGWQHHPTPLVESAAMAAVQPPVPTYQPTLSPDVIEGPTREVKNPDGSTRKVKIGLTDAALESVVYAGQAHQNFLPAAEGAEPMRRGYFIGDGTGAGKGRQIVGVIADNMNQGKPKHVWLSKGDKLFSDAQRDLTDMGVDPKSLIHFDRLAKGDFKADKGIAFMSYSLLRSGPKDASKPRNVDRLIDWLGKDFDGVIAFDESHLLGSADDTPGLRGVVKASQQAQAAIKLQRALPKAKVLYVSATGATKPENLAYGERLGLWGRGTSFADKKDFLEQMHAGGTSALESVAQSMKARGLYNARSLSYDGVKTDRLSHTLTDEQKYVYDNLAEAWQEVHKNIDEALKHLAGGEENEKHTGQAKAAAKSQFQGAQQRFFNQLITSLMVPTVLKHMENDLKEGRSPVVQLTNTMEAATKRALADREEGEELEEVDISPRQMLIDFLNNSFPVNRMEKYQDEDGNEGMRVATDSNGKPIEDPHAVAMRDELVSRAHDLRIPQSPLDQIINHFGHENVAEATGRSIRLINKTGDDGVTRLTEERRNSKIANEAEARAFQNGKKKIMIFSEAGGTGASYHADRSAPNQAQRSHYLLQPGWRADTAVQGLGRTHRTNQASAPIFHLLETPEVPGQKRFVSTIARRLSQLGALTRGQAKTGGGVELFNAADNLESKEAQAGLESFINTLKRGGTTINGQGYHELMPKLGFKVDNDKGGGAAYRVRGQSEVPEMRQFLNRALALKLADQQEVFKQLDEHISSKVEQARADGTLDEGVEKYNADKIERDGPEQTVYRDPETGAEAKLITTKVTRKNPRRAWVENSKGKLPLKFVKNDRSGRVWAVYDAAAKTDERGNITPMYALKGPGTTQHLPQHQIDPQSYRTTGFTQIEHPEAKKLWDTEHAALPEVIETPEHFVTGDLLSVWDKLPSEKPKIFRVPLGDGTSIVGRHVPAHKLEATLKNLGVSQAAKEGGTLHAPADVHRKVLGGAYATLANGWNLKRALVGGEHRIELVGPIGMHRKTLEKDGVMVEKIAHKERFFVPTGDDGTKVLERVIKSRNAPVTEVKNLN